MEPDKGEIATRRGGVVHVAVVHLEVGSVHTGRLPSLVVGGRHGVRYPGLHHSACPSVGQIARPPSRFSPLAPLCSPACLPACLYSCKSSRTTWKGPARSCRYKGGIGGREGQPNEGRRRSRQTWLCAVPAQVSGCPGALSSPRSSTPSWVLGACVGGVRLFCARGGRRSGGAGGVARKKMEWKAGSRLGSTLHPSGDQRRSQGC